MARRVSLSAPLRLQPCVEIGGSWHHKLKVKKGRSRLVWIIPPGRATYVTYVKGHRHRTSSDQTSVKLKTEVAEYSPCLLSSCFLTVEKEWMKCVRRVSSQWAISVMSVCVRTWGIYSCSVSHRHIVWSVTESQAVIHPGRGNQAPCHWQRCFPAAPLA